MATITITKITCIRKKELTGNDEPVLEIAGRERWKGKLGKGGHASPNESERFSGDISVKLLERDGNNPKKDKTLGSWTVDDTPTGPDTLTATSSGYHYEVDIRVA